MFHKFKKLSSHLFIFFIVISLVFSGRPNIWFGFISPLSINKVYAANWYDNGWNYRTKITILNSKVDSNISNFPIYVDLSNMPLTFHNHVKSDGGDIRVTTDDGITEVPRELVSYNSGSDKGELWFKGSILDTTIVISEIKNNTSKFSPNKFLISSPRPVSDKSYSIQIDSNPVII